MIMENVELAHEMMVVGGMIESPEKCIDYAVASLSADSFFDEDLKIIFEMVSKRHYDREPIMTNSLIVDLVEVIGKNAVSLLTDIVGNAMGFDYWNFPYYVSRVQDSDQLRQFRTLQDSLQEGLDGFKRGAGDSPGDLIETIGGQLAIIGERRSVDVKTAYESGMEVLEDNDARSDEVAGVEFGMVNIDNKIGGLQPGELITIAGRPGGGKSVASLQLCRSVCASGGAALFVSLEMTRKELTNRLIAGLSTINVASIRQAKMEADDVKLYSRALSTIESWDFFISDRPGLTFAEIRQAAKSQKAKGNLDLLIVDYIRLVKPVSKRLEKRDQIAETTQGLKELAKELGVPVIGVCQMNREADKLQVPKLSNLADSSAVEQDSDIVIFLHRQDPTSTETDFIVAKHRHGTQFSEKVELNTVTMMFEQPTGWVA